MHSKKELDERLRRAGLQPLKKLSQNFLINEKISELLVKAVLRFQPKTVIEIGPGLGALTDSLLKIPAKLVLLELDSGLVKYWKEREPSIHIHHVDALRFEWETLSEQEPVVIVSNLPYSIAGSLVLEISAVSTVRPDGLIFMFQKEVAQRILARPHDEDYGILSVVAQVHWKIDPILDAGPQDFFPVPHVGSRVLCFKRSELVLNSAAFLSYVKAAFSQRRKKMITNLGAFYKRPDLEAAFAQLHIGDNTRAQEIDPLGHVSLFKHLQLLATGQEPRVLA